MLQGKRVLVMGLGRSGRAAARLARAKGARVVGIDLRTGLDPIDGVTLELGPHRPARFDEADIIVVSPGIPVTQPLLRAAVDAGTDVVGELGFALRFLELPMVGITGTNGKSTVTWFTGQLLRAAGKHPFVGGNLGTPLCDAVLGDDGFDCLVVEVSSYQLELPGELRPDLGVILNLSPDHLARHGDMAGYAAAKARMFERMTSDQLAILPAGDRELIQAAAHHGGTRAWLGAYPGAVRDGRSAHIVLPGLDVHLTLDGFAVPGEHNLDNAVAAAMFALVLGAPEDAVQTGLANLEALDHRMQVVAALGGVTWINDSKATNLQAAKVGFGGLDQPAVVLLGGQGKPDAHGKLGFGSLAADLQRHRAVVTLGEAGPQISAELAEAGLNTHSVASLEEAVDLAASLALPGDVVLLSPGCASFDQFDDFEHRGRAFAALVHRREP